MATARYRRSTSSSLGLLLVVVFLLLIAAGGFWGFREYRDSKFNKFGRLNIAFAVSPVLLLSISPQDKSAVVVRLPDDLYISELAFGYGAYKSLTIYDVGALDKRGGETVAQTLSDYIGIPVDGYIRSGIKVPKDIKNFFWDPRGILKAQSDLNLSDRLQLWLAVLQMRFDKINSIDLGKWAGTLLLADGSSALSLDKEVVDNSLSGLFVENRVREEGYRVEVVNSTRVLGLGNRAGRLLVNIGANVVSVETSDSFLPGCQITVVNKARNSATVSRIAQIFTCQILPKDDLGRAEIVVTIGQDYAKKLGK